LDHGILLRFARQRKCARRFAVVSGLEILVKLSQIVAWLIGESFATGRLLRLWLNSART
jgi:hypothetical protein